MAREKSISRIFFFYVCVNSDILRLRMNVYNLTTRYIFMVIVKSPEQVQYLGDMQSWNGRYCATQNLQVGAKRKLSDLE